MKKVYSKPEIMFESFALSTAIAACAENTHLPSAGECGLEYGPDQVLFVDGSTGCNFWNDAMGEKICYHNPTDENNLFGS